MHQRPESLKSDLSPAPLKAFPTSGARRSLPIAPSRDGEPPLRATRGDRRADPGPPVPPAHPARRAQGGGEEHDDPDARELDPGGALLRATPDAVHVARRAVRAGLDDPDHLG